MASADCPDCKHTTTIDPGTHDVTKIIPVKDRDGKTWGVYLVTCERCQREVRAGGKDGRGNV
jgi:hypothetical protein